jgi:hypothetical protein
MPLILDAARPGLDSYVWTLPPIENGVARSWHYQGSMRSFQWRDGGIVKMRNAFTSHRSHDAFYSLLEDGARRGVLRPSSYASFFHDCYHSPRATGPARRAMSWLIPGGWESILLPKGDYPGPWYRYDLRSAYLWALGYGLPDPATYRFTERLTTTANGCYIMDCEPSDGAPYPYDRGGTLPILRDEIEAYGIRGRVRYGITWSSMLPAGPLQEIIMSWPFWKEIGRAYWGRWAATAPLECATWRDCTRVTRWELPAAHANPIWAHVILSRVRSRLYDATRAGTVARVYVDNVIINRQLPTTDCLGGWRLEAEYDGIRVSNLHRITSLQENAVYVAA